MVARFIKLQHDSIYQGADGKRSPAVAAEGTEAGSAGGPARGRTLGILWKQLRAAHGIVPVIRVIGLIVAAYTDTLILYLGFFTLYVPAAFVVLYAKLLRASARLHRRAANPGLVGLAHAEARTDTAGGR
jgi:hypothetical protein